MWTIQGGERNRCEPVRALLDGPDELQVCDPVHLALRAEAASGASRRSDSFSA
jgi:hypothetical protein